MKILSIFLLLVILVSISRAQTSTDSITTNSPSQDLEEDAVTAEYYNENNGDNAIESTTIVEDKETFTTEAQPNLETTTTVAENDDQSAGNRETPNTEEIVTESQTDVPINNDSTVTEAVDTTPAAIEKETSTSSDLKEATNEVNEEIHTSTITADEPITTTVSPAPICSTPGVQANELDCRQYYDCSLEGSADGNLHVIAKSCPEKQAFNAELNRCSRDISSCSLGINCTAKESIADPANNSSYYLCEPRLEVRGFRLFHVNCASYEVYYPLYNKCYIDLNSLPIVNWEPVKDIDIVKAELKLLKKQDKLKLKQEMDRKKKLEKEAKKKAKEEEKLNKSKSKLEIASFVCNEEGNFASQIADNIYIACINKKGKFKAVSMKCNSSTTFNPQTGSCDLNSTSDNGGSGDNDSSVSDDEDDD